MSRLVISHVDPPGVPTRDLSNPARIATALLARGGYPSVDEARTHPDPTALDGSTQALAAREKFLSEHTHAEDEVRFFVDGSSLFCLRDGDDVLLMLCEQGDLISVPA